MKKIKAIIATLYPLLQKIKDSYYFRVIFLIIVVALVSVKVTSMLHKSGTIATQIIPQYKTVTRYIDKGGNNLAEIKQLQADKQSMKILIDSLNLKIKAKGEIREVSSHIQKIDTIFVKVKGTRDVDTLSFLKQDGYISIGIKANIATNEADISLKSIDTLTSITKVRSPLIGRTTSTITINNKNPYNKIIEGYSVRLKEKQTLISIGIQGGYNPISQKFYYGIGATIPIINIKSRK